MDRQTSDKQVFLWQNCIMGSQNYSFIKWIESSNYQKNLIDELEDVVKKFVKKLSKDFFLVPLGS